MLLSILSINRTKPKETQFLQETGFMLTKQMILRFENIGFYLSNSSELELRLPNITPNCTATIPKIMLPNQ